MIAQIIEAILQNFKTDCTDLKSKRSKPVYLQTETTNGKGEYYRAK
jgi:hypothetical protein